MMKKVIVLCLILCMAIASVAGCTQAAAPASPTAAPAAPAEATPAEPAAVEPTVPPADEKPLKVALVVADTIEGIYNRTVMLALNHLKDEGYPFELNYIENVTADTAESVLRTYAESGYDVILAHAGITRDAVIKIHQEYPDIAFIGSGNNWETPAPNIGAYDQALHEGCYLLGALAGSITKSNVIGFVAGMPTANVTSEANAYTAGAKAVNPDISVQVAYIESWYDPVKAKELTNAQIAMGADVIFSERDGVIQACQEKGVYAVAEKIDQIPTAPDTVLACAIIRWDNTLREIFDAVRAGKFENRYYTTYEGSMKLGICQLVLNDGIDIPKDVLDKVHDLEQQITSGALSIPFEP